MVDLLLMRESLKPLTCLTFADSSQVSARWIGQPMAESVRPGRAAVLLQSLSGIFRRTWIRVIYIDVSGLLICSDRDWLAASVNLLAVCLR